MQDELSKLEGTQLPTSVQPTNSPSTSYSSAQVLQIALLHVTISRNIVFGLVFVNSVSCLARMFTLCHHILPAHNSGGSFAS